MSACVPACACGLRWETSTSNTEVSLVSVSPEFNQTRTHRVFVWGELITTTTSVCPLSGWWRHKHTHTTQFVCVCLFISWWVSLCVVCFDLVSCLLLSSPPNSICEFELFASGYHHQEIVCVLLHPHHYRHLLWFVVAVSVCLFHSFVMFVLFAFIWLCLSCSN